MSEAPRDYAEQQQEIIGNVVQRMKLLHAQSRGEKSDEERISEGMSNQIMGATTQRAHQVLIEHETHRLQRQAEEEAWDPDLLQLELAVMKNRITADMFKEHWFESTLSTPDHPIHAATYGTSMFRYDLRTLMAENPTEERMAQFGWVMFDVNALRSFKDCTSHAHTTDFLRGIVRILVDPQSRTNRWLEESGVRAIPMATGGDEFVLYLRSRNPLSAHFINETVSSFQVEVSTSESLRSFLDFDDEGVLVTYGMPSSLQRREFAQLPPDERQRRLAEIRATLPETFVPSMAGGGALLSEGILLAVEKDEHDLQGPEETFQSLREKIVQGTIDLTESRQKKNKERDLRRLEITNPREHAFRYRNQENRRLLDQNRLLQERLGAVERQLAEVRFPAGQVLRREED